MMEFNWSDSSDQLAIRTSRLVTRSLDTVTVPARTSSTNPAIWSRALDFRFRYGNLALGDDLIEQTDAFGSFGLSTMPTSISAFMAYPPFLSFGPIFLSFRYRA
jgi:hypothetical protein